MRKNTQIQSAAGRTETFEDLELKTVSDPCVASMHASENWNVTHYNNSEYKLQYNRTSPKFHVYDQTKTALPALTH